MRLKVRHPGQAALLRRLTDRQCARQSARDRPAPRLPHHQPPAQPERPPPPQSPPRPVRPLRLQPATQPRPRHAQRKVIRLLTITN